MGSKAIQVLDIEVLLADFLTLISTKSIDILIHIFVFVYKM